MKVLIVYNLETNLDSEVLAAAHDWVEAFAAQVDKVFVYSTHVGRNSLPANVVVKELGGGSFLKRFLALLRLYKSFGTSLKYRRNLCVFHHMSPRTLLILGPLYKIARINQGLWYSHSKKSLSLKYAHMLANNIFSSTPSAIPIVNSRIRFVGHGIKSKPLVDALKTSTKKRSGILALGRVVPIKNIELAISAISKSKYKDLKITCIGPHQVEGEYVQSLRDFAISHQIDLKIEQAIAYSKIPQTLAKFEYIFTGTPKSVDKAVIEGAMSGCFVLAVEKEILKITGMLEVWRELGYSNFPQLSEQLNVLRTLDVAMEENLRAKLSAEAVLFNEINSTVEKILSEIC
jgi:glycosyltransferase involved in cell wall biosynthesis